MAFGNFHSISKALVQVFMPVCVNGSCNHNTQTCKWKKVIKVSILKYYQYAQLFTISSVSCFHQCLFFALIFHPQTNLEAFQDIFSVYLTGFKFDVLLCIYVICSEQKIVLNSWVVFKTDKKIEYLPVTESYFVC